MSCEPNTSSFDHFNDNVSINLILRTDLDSQSLSLTDIREFNESQFLAISDASVSVSDSKQNPGGMTFTWKATPNTATRLYVKGIDTTENLFKEISYTTFYDWNGATLNSKISLPQTFKYFSGNSSDKPAITHTFKQNKFYTVKFETYDTNMTLYSTHSLNRKGLDSEFGVFGNVNGVITDVNGVITDVNGVITDVNGVITDVNGVITDVNGVITDVNGVITDVNGVITDVNGVITDVNGVITDVNGVITDVNGVITDVNGVITDVNGAMSIDNGVMSINNEKRVLIYEATE
ncbi:hypothetical protein CHS0354_024109 [Potamilus streckersoni]|uniref:Uncharacterized protein n=1 Tax=Potamilus streckersoni TaxID=2493646 RepID=A0AAE0VMW3_9BIVA|nr:hypothetical protein CHS0354_024109 [Potamilus streckersoni]